MKSVFLISVLTACQLICLADPYEFEVRDGKVSFKSGAERPHDFKKDSVIIIGPGNIGREQLEDNDFLWIFRKNKRVQKIFFSKALLGSYTKDGKNIFTLSDEYTKGNDITCIYIAIAIDKMPAATLKLFTEGSSCDPPSDLSAVIAAVSTPEALGQENNRINISGDPASLHQHWDYLAKAGNPKPKDCDWYENEKNNDNLYYYDFKYKKFYKPHDSNKRAINIYKELKMHNKDYVQFRILNINRYLYDIDIQTADVSYTSEVPALFRQFFQGDSLGFLGRLMNGFTNSLPDGLKSQVNKQILDGKTVDNKYDSFKKALLEFNDYYNSLEAEQLKAYYVCDAFSCCDQDNFSIPYPILAEKLLNVRTTLSEFQVYIGKYETITASRKKLSDYLAEQKSCAGTDEVIAVLEGKIKPLKALEKPSEGQKAELASLEKELASQNEKKCSKERKATLQQQIDLEQEKLQFTTGINNLQASLPSETDLKKLYLFVQNVRNQHNTFITPPLYAQGNRLELIIKTQRNDSSLAVKWDIMPLYDDSLYLSIPVTGKPMISFSSGSFVGFGLRNKTYVWQPALNNLNQVTDSSKYLLVEQGYTNPPIGFSALMHVQWKSRGSVAIGASVGVGLTIERTPNLAYLLGGTLFFGDLHQVAVTGGIAGMRVNRLSNNHQYLADQKILYSNTLKPDPIYYPEFRAGSFLSISYTLFGTDRRTLYHAEKRKNR